MKRMTVRMRDELAEGLEKCAEQNERSLHGEIVHALDEYISVKIAGKITADGKVEIDPAYADYLAGKTLDPRD